MGVDWGEYLGTEDPYEIEDMLRDEGIREQERIQNGDYDEDDEEKHVKTLNDDDIPFWVRARESEMILFLYFLSIAHILHYVQ